MEAKNRLYRADRPDRFKNILRRSGRSGRSGRSYGNHALSSSAEENKAKALKISHNLKMQKPIFFVKKSNKIKIKRP